MITRLTDSGAMPTLERLLQFTSARHQVLADNIANLSTPYYKPRDLSVESFQAALRQVFHRHLRFLLELGDLLDVLHQNILEARPTLRGLWTTRMLRLLLQTMQAAGV